MHVFLSYPSEARDVADRLRLALAARGYDVFYDREDLAPGHAYDQAIARAIGASDLFVFLVTPAAVAAGRYTLTELGLAERKWAHPGGRVLPVLVQPTAMEALPAYLRAVTILTPRGDVVAETAEAVDRLAGSLPLSSRLRRRLRSWSAAAAVAAAAAVGTALWAAADREGPPNAADTTGGRSPMSGAGVVPLPDPVRHRARAVAPLADGGFAVATATPSQLVRYSPSGAPIGAPIPLAGEPVAIARTPTQLLVVTRAPDGVTVFDGRDLRVVDTVTLDPGRVARPDSVSRAVRLSGDIQSVAVDARGMLWAVTGERDGEPAVLRFRPPERRWEVPTWERRLHGIVGGDARGLRLRTIGGQVWAVTAETTPSSLYHLAYPFRVDEFGGHDLRLVSCAHDLAATSSGHLLFLSCDNELQEVAAEARELRLLGSRRTLPPEHAPDTWTWEIVAPAGASAVVALNTEVGQPDNRPGRVRVVEVAGDGTVHPLLDARDAVATSLAVTPRWVAVVLRQADGGTESIRIPRAR